MESVAFFDQKIALTPKDLNRISQVQFDDLLLEKAKESLEEHCTSNGFVLPGTLKLLSRSVGYFEPARFTGDAIYYLKLEGHVLYPTEGTKLRGKVIRKNKMGIYVVHRDAIRIQVVRDLHIGNEDFENIDIGDTVEVEIKKSRFQVNDPFILSSGVFISKITE